MSITATQNAAILAHLRAGNGITQLEAYDLFGCVRLPSRIHEIKKQLAESGEGHITDRYVPVKDGNPVKEYRFVRAIKRGDRVNLGQLQFGDRFCANTKAQTRYTVVALYGDAWPLHMGVLADGGLHTERMRKDTTVIFLRAATVSSTD